MKNYDPQLRSRLAATNDRLDEVVLNVRFRDWNDYLVEDTKRRVSRLELNPCGDRYQHSPDRELFALCQEHAAGYNQPLTADNVLVLVHPFYLSLTHIVHLDESNQEEYKGYLDRLLNFLDAKPDRSKLGIVIFDSVHHYASASSLLVESGAVDLALLTEYDSGYLINNSDLSYFEDKSFFFAGGYNDQCLSSAIENVLAIDFQKTEGFSEIWAVRDLVLNSPLRFSELIPQSVRGVRESRNIDLDGLIKKLNL